MSKIHEFFGLLPCDLEELLKKQGFSPVHAKAIFKNAYKKHSLNPWLGEHLPRELPSFFSEEYGAASLFIKKSLISKYDHSVKFLFTLVDGLEIESVLMPERSRLTLCVSSQVGCAQKCAFCHTGRMGLLRNLSAAEIVAQVVSINRWIHDQPEWHQNVNLNFKAAYVDTHVPVLRYPHAITNVVFMGMGEPLDNVSSVLKATNIFKEQYALGLCRRRITVSTAGHLDGLKEIDQKGFDCCLALSLHVPDSKERSKVMPINRRFSILDVLDYLKSKNKLKKQKLMIQYTLIEGVNDSKQHAEKLIHMLDGLDAKINIIPLNPIDPSSLKGPSLDSLTSFASFIYAKGLPTFVRYSKAQDIYGACGQLVK